MPRLPPVAKAIDLFKKCGKLGTKKNEVSEMYLPEVERDFIWSVVGSPWGLPTLWLVLINLVTFLVFGVDKLKAKRKSASIRRVPEKTLFLLAALGGSVGALVGMRVWHHKTLHKTFRLGIPAILILQSLISLYLYFNVIR